MPTVNNILQQTYQCQKPVILSETKDLPDELPEQIEYGFNPIKPRRGDSIVEGEMIVEFLCKESDRSIYLK